MIDPALAAFLEEGLGIHIGTRDAHLQPAGARAIAVRPEPDGLHLVVYVSEVAAARLLDNLRDNLQAAVTFVRPVDDRACQVKGLFHTVRPATEAERAFVAAQWDRFLQQLEHIGIPRGGSAAWVTWPAVAIRIQVNAVFDQTPGPHAGSAIS
jgi:hypothetical protein